jgi:hypothetical protein
LTVFWIFYLTSLPLAITLILALLLWSEYSYSSSSLFSVILR